jgi:hypothetical protein
MCEDSSKTLREIVRVERVLPKRGTRFQDLVLVECASQERPFGLARVQPDRKVLLHDIELPFSLSMKTLPGAPAKVV